MGSDFSRGCAAEDAVITNKPSSTGSSSITSNAAEGALIRQWTTTSDSSDDKEKVVVKPKRHHGIIKGRPAARARKSKVFFFTLATAYVIVCSIVSLCQKLLVDCAQETFHQSQNCHDHRYMKLVFLTPRECAFGRRIIFATLFGAMIGWERRQADRPVGIRLMALASLGSCLFTICGVFAFVDGPMGWDASRISAAIPKGVGFLGAGIIWKQIKENSHTGISMQQIYGLTTSASLWLSAAVGIACAGEMYFIASFAIAVMTTLLHFGSQSNIHTGGIETEV